MSSEAPPRERPPASLIDGWDGDETSLSLSISTGLTRRRARRSWGKFFRDELIIPGLRFGIFYVVILVGLVLAENSLVYPGGTSSQELYSAAFQAVGKATGRPIEEVTFSAPDGPKLNGWFVSGEPGAPVVLMFHGNGGEIAGWSRMQMEMALASRGSVLAMDYRGYGRSEGAATESGVLADARAARRWLADRCRVREDEIILYGRSFGGAVAIDLARDGAKGLFVEATFTSLPDVAAEKFFIFPVRLMMSNRFDSLSKVGDVKCPTLFVHGSADSLVPCAHSEALFATCGAPRKEHICLPDVGHSAPWTEAQWKIRAAFFRWLEHPESGLDLDAPAPPYIELNGQTVHFDAR